MTEFAWQEKLSIGNALLDAEHKMLIDMVNCAESAIRRKKAEALLQAVDILVDCVCVHFENEERIAQAINLSFFEHKMEHQYVINELRSMKDELANNNGKWSESAAEHYSYFLSAWLHEHLIEEPKIIKSVLQTFPYHFDPVSKSTRTC
jgi:hemerythrin